MAAHAALVTAADHLNRGRTSQAVDLLRHHLQSFPKDDQAQWLLGSALCRLQQFDQAVFFLERAAKAHPHEAERWLTLGEALWFGSPGPKKAEAFLRTCPPVLEGHDIGLGLLAAVLEINGKVGESVAILRTILPRHPGHLKMLGCLGRQLAEAGHIEEALVHLTAAASPGNPLDLAQLCFFLNHASAPTPAEVFAQHKRLYRIIEQGLPLSARPEPGPWPDRPLRIGFVSAEMREHSVAYFFEPLLDHLDRTVFQVQIFAAGHPRDDVVTQRLRSKADLWRAFDPLDTPAMAAAIRAERPDVLIDLGGLTGAVLVLAFAQRPAPLQGSYLGYPNTCAIPNVDFRLVDALTDPPAPFDDGTRSDDLATERLVRLDGCFLCYRPYESAPAVAARPQDAPVVFGSFNTSTKISPACVALWSGVLRRVPAARLLLKARGFEDAWVRDEFARAFEREGVEPSRLTLLGQTRSLPAHFETYAQVDIALDTCPYNGTTTTCEAMWMGVPVVTLAGRSHASRVGVSLLHAAGLPENAAATPEAFIDQAAHVAADRAALTALRSTLRDRLRASALCDGPGFARRFEGAIRSAWRSP